MVGGAPPQQINTRARGHYSQPLAYTEVPPQPDGLQDQAKQLTVHVDRDQSAHTMGVHATKDEGRCGEEFRNVQCLIEEWESKEVEEADDRPTISYSRRKSSDFLIKLARYETVTENVVQRGKEITHTSPVQEFLDIDTGGINPTNQFESRKCSRTVSGRIKDGGQLLAKIPTNQRRDKRVTL